MDRVWSADKWHGIQVTWWAIAGLLAIMAVFGVLNGALNKIYRPVDGLVQGVVGRMGSGKSLFVVQRVLLPYCAALGKRGFVLSDSKRRMRRVVTNFRFDPGTDIEIRTVRASETVSIFLAVRQLAEAIGRVEGPWYDERGILCEPTEHEMSTVCAVCRNVGPCGDRHGVELVEEFDREPILNAVVVLDEMHLYANSGNLALGKEASWLISMARKLNAEVWWCSQHEMKVHKRLRDESSYIWLASKWHGPATWILGSGWHIAREFVSPALVERARSAAGTGKGVAGSDKRIYKFSNKSKQFYNSFELLTADPTALEVRAARAKHVGGSGRMQEPSEAFGE
jgi:hypothetical protein